MEVVCLLSLLTICSCELIQVLETLDAVLDVGGIYDPETDRYDHHQRGFDQNFGHGFVTKLSSAGLVYKVELSFSLSPIPSLATMYLILLGFLHSPFHRC